MWVGESLRRVEDRALVTGAGRFVADYESAARDCLALRFVRSTAARGRILAIEAPDGAQMFTGQDLAEVPPIRPLLHRPDFQPVGQPVLACDEVRFVGEALAVVVAPSQSDAEDLAQSVIVDVDPLDPILDVGAALEPGSPTVHPRAESNVLIEARMATDGIDEVFERAAQVVEIDLRSGRENAMPLEARGAYVEPDPATGRITLVASTQNAHIIRTVIADLLEMPESQLRVVAPDVGGGFGQKQCLPAEYVVAVWVARRLNKPVAWIEDRRENFLSSFHSRDQRYTVRGAFDDRGRLLAVDADLLCNVGAYSSYPVTGAVETLMAFGELPGPYDFENYRVRSRGVLTNTCTVAPYRGVSRPVITLAMERLIDIGGRRLGIDPVEMRRINLVRDFPYVSPTGLTMDKGAYVESLDEAVRLIDLDAFRPRQEVHRNKGEYLGIGFCTLAERTAYGTPVFAGRSMDVVPGFEQVDMTMDPSGYVEARIGTSPHGQGLATSLSQVIADELGVTPDKVRVEHGDTDRTPYGWGTFASRSMVLSGGAAKLAAEKLREKVKLVAAELLEVGVDDVDLISNTARVKGTDISIGLREVARTAYHRAQKLPEDVTPGLSATGVYDPPGTYSNACHTALVRVDTETGEVILERFLVVEDAGVLINPMIADGQVAGGVAQGIGGALYENLVYDEWGNLVTTSLMDYLVPTAAEIPEIEVHHLETVTDHSITGAKGLGEGGTIGASPAVISAISDALSPFGIEVLETPATPDHIRGLIRAAKG